MVIIDTRSKNYHNNNGWSHRNFADEKLHWFAKFDFHVRSNSHSSLHDIAQRRWLARVHGTLKESRSVHFFADSRDLTGCRYYVVGHCCRGPPFRWSVYPLTSNRGDSPSLLSFPHPSHNIARSPIRSADPIFIVSRRPEPPHSTRMRRP